MKPLALGPLGLGAAPLGNMHQPVLEADAATTIDTALALGVRYFDVAPLYGLGVAERRLGEALAGREDVVVSTKVGRLLVPRPPGEDAEGIYVETPPLKVAFDYSREGVLRSYEESLARLGRSGVDILFVHDIDSPTHGSDEAAEARTRELIDRGGWRALDELRRAGDVAAIGVGVNACAPCLRMLQLADPDVFLLAGRYTLLDQSALPALLPACARRGVGVILGGPFNSGVLAGGGFYDYAPASREILARARRLADVCARHGASLTSAALQFCLAGPAVACVLAGARSAAEVRANVAAMGTDTPAALWHELKAERLISEEAPTPC